MPAKLYLILAGGGVAIAAFIFWKMFLTPIIHIRPLSSSPFDIATDPAPNSTAPRATAPDNSTPPPTGPNNTSRPQVAPGPVTFPATPIIITDGVKHIVPLEEILGGGPPQDGIPSIDNPRFISPTMASSWLKDTEPGLALEKNGVNRFYPFQILVWHEIVNDTIDSQRILITYCPLCMSGIVFDPLVKGERVEFGTSGKLWNSNLVMYDRKTESLWSQILGQSILGEMAGVQLTVLPSDQMRFGEWKKLHPQGEVLSKETGASRLYGQDPYGDYYTAPDTYFPLTRADTRLPAKTFILGLVINGQAKAYPPEAIERVGSIEDTFAGMTIIARYEPELDVVRIFSAEGGSASGGEKKLKRLNPFASFWFAWAAAHPGTAVYK